MEKRIVTLRAADLAVGYGKRPVVSEVSFVVCPGEILTLIGPNGAGKSTLLKSITGQLAPMGGTVFLEQQDMATRDRKELAKEMSILMTGRLHAELMTCREVVETGRYPYTGRLGILSPKDRETVESAMELVGISALAAADFSQISDGQRQLVLLARAICQEPKVLVLDEPTSYLDIRHKLALMDILRQLARQRQIAVIQSLHELELAQKCSDYLLCIRDGRVDRFGTPEEVFFGDYIRTLYRVEAGSFSNCYSSLELPASAGAPEVFVIGGAGQGIPVYRQLQRRGIPFAVGILWENDLDYPAASALAAEVLSVPFGGTPDDAVIAEAKALIETTEYTLCPLPDDALQGSAAFLRALKEYAIACGKLKTEAQQHGL